MLAEIASKSMEEGTPVLRAYRVSSTDLVHPNRTAGIENLKIFETEKRPKNAKKEKKSELCRSIGAYPVIIQINYI